MKVCRSCFESKELSQFYKHKKMLDGYLNNCIECVKAKAIKNRLANIDYYREYDRKRGANPERIKARMDYQKTPKGRQLATAAKLRYANNNPDKRKAHHKLNNAIRDGKIQKQPCLVCGCEKSEAHHVSYDLPLDVVWLCGTHHKQVHKEHRAYLRETETI